MTLQEKFLSRSVLGVEYVKVLIGVLLLFACSQIRIPLDPVPITLQTTAVMLIGLTYSRASTSILAIGCYLMIGAFGAPVFNGYNGGIAYMSGATLGYLVGFMMSVVVMHAMRSALHFKNSAVKSTIVCVAGLATIYVFGVSWLSYLLGFEKAVAVGLIPFIGPEAVKAITLVGLVRLLRSE